ncbi:undecaprenyl/decaprenyl-phosphate alpha-N-acetylglucosaminyl 1-phosphate transferase [Patescibacteria group bacterium]|nr:undecaprenyl/decaprenyl-phosphate alpha-N-acetylglucosaminyl 1-phosphate transferase [Patescibacteria group bacterium]
MTVTILLVILLSAAITYLFTPLVAKIAQKYNLVDNPKKRMHPAHTHEGIIPRAGGTAIFLGLFIPILLLFPVTKTIIGIFLGALILITVGIWDDVKDRSPYIRFLVNCLAAVIAIGTGVGIAYITNPLGGIVHLDIYKITFNFFGSHTIIVLADIFALLWIVWTTNIVGWSGGVDGQLPGFVAISAFVIGLLSLRFIQNDPNQLHVTYLSFATAGAFLGFLPWNFYPQKIMPGYSGKTLAGFMLAILSILSYSKLGTSLLVLVVPMTDAAFLFVRRILSGRSPVWATSGHLHHHLLSLGWSKRKIAVFYWIISAAAGLAALLLNSRHKLYAGILILAGVAAFILWINFFRKLPTRKDIEDF